MGFKLLGINGSLTPPPSRTRIVLDVALSGARAFDPDLETEVLELRDFALEFCDGRSPESYNSDTRRALELVEQADAYLVATPIYRGSYTGALKNFLTLYRTIHVAKILCVARSWVCWPPGAATIIIWLWNMNCGPYWPSLGR